MTEDSSSDIAAGKDGIVDRLLRIVGPMWLSYDLTSHSYTPLEYMRQSAGESSTILPDVPLYLRSATSIEVQESHFLDEEIESIVALASEEFIEDGMDSATEVCLGDFVAEFSETGVRHLASYLTSDWIGSGTVADIVRVLGRLDHEKSHDDRLWIASHLLFSEAPIARDAAALALEDLGDGRAISKLEAAVKVELIPGLRDDLEMALRELKNSTDEHVP